LDLACPTPDPRNKVEPFRAGCGAGQPPHPRGQAGAQLFGEAAALPSALRARQRASWLNLVECWFALLTRRRLQRGAFTSTRELEEATLAYIAETNADPKPFGWIASSGPAV
jgi:hypothetical protein